MDYCAKLEAEIEILDERIAILRDELYRGDGEFTTWDDVEYFEGLIREYEKLLAEYDC